MRKNERRATHGVCIFLGLIIGLVFGPSVGHEFVNYDDGLYVNESVNGLTMDRVIRAFTHGSADNWDPITTLSHIVDCQLYGLEPGGHHLTNVLLHAATAILLFLVLRQMTGAFWRCAFVAAVFAIHPLRVESVVWVAERKDVLSGLFFMLTLGAYARYVKRGTVTSERFKSEWNTHATERCWRSFDYGCVLLFFALGLMSKPMLVTLPFVLLLLDYWPFKRFIHPTAGAQSGVPLWKLIFEKLPLCALSGVVVMITLHVQIPAMREAATASLSDRIANAVVSYTTYLWQTFWPANLSAFYPYTKHGAAEITCSALVLAAISVVAFIARRKHPCLLIGWLWYLGMLVPVIGLVQAGLQAHADRYTYLPHIGIYLALAWTAVSVLSPYLRNMTKVPCVEGESDWKNRIQLQKANILIGSLSLTIIIVLSAISSAQTFHWRDSESLWRHALACTKENAIAHNNLGAVLVGKGRSEEAITHYEKVVELKPDAPACNNLGAALLQSGRLTQAAGQFQKSLTLKPNYVEAHINLGITLTELGQTDDALFHLKRAVAISPDHLDANYNLGLALSESERWHEAINVLEKTLRLGPEDATLHAKLGSAFLKTGRVKEALAHFQKTLQLAPESADTCREMGWILATCPDESIRNGANAFELAQRAVRLSGGSDPRMYGPLAAALAEKGDFAGAIAAANRALDLATSQENLPLAAVIRTRIEQFRSAVPVRDPIQPISAVTNVE